MGDRFLKPELVMRSRFASNPIPQWEAAILCFRNRQGCDILVNKFNAKPIEGYKVFYGIDATETSRQVFEAEINGIKVGIITRLSWGGPQAAIIVEELAFIGVKYILGYGTAGSINKTIGKGQQVVGVKSLITDGTSKSYVSDRAELLGNSDLINITKEVSTQIGHDVKEVCVANVDALYRETKKLISEYQTMGADIVNLETSALFAACESCNIASTWIGFISDCLVDEAWDDWHIDSLELSNIASEICLEVIRAIF